MKVIEENETEFHIEVERSELPLVIDSPGKRLFVRLAKEEVRETPNLPANINDRLIYDLGAIPEMFTDGVRGIMLIRRNKDGETGNAQRKAIKRISRSTEEWKEIVRELRHMQQHSHQGYRIYSSVNSRDITKAIHEFKRRQLETDYGNMWEFHNFYCDVKNRFFSCLMNPNCRETSNFLIDCDSVEAYEHAELQLRNSGLILLEYRTKNGFHIITRPFNPSDYGNMEIKKDEMMFIG